MAVNWTKEQTEVIESRNRNLLVSAAAGSGKTAVLVERMIRMISEGEAPLDIDRLLVMTFTKAAAAQMRERIQAAIEKKLEETPDDIHLQQQAVMVQYAQITTIDSFCLTILREHFDRLDLDPAFRVGDEGELLLMRAEVMEALLEDFYENGGSRFERFVDTYASGKADGGIADYVFQVYSFAQSNPWPREWFARCREELSCSTAGEFDRTKWMQFLFHDVRLSAQEWERQLLRAVEICQEEDGPVPYLPMLLEDLEQVRALKGTASYEQFSRTAAGFTFSKLAAVRGKNSLVSPEKKEAVADCRKRIKKSVEKLKELYLFGSADAALLDMEEGREAVELLIELAEEFSLRFQQKKQEKNVVDFSDLEHFALEILMEPDEGGGGRRPSAAADELSAQYEEIMVDEYQDSNLVQETLIQSISRERFGSPNVFMVGDVKQSIYKFRLARPELFLEKYHSYREEPTKDNRYLKIELHQNFRSREQVLSSINDIFYRIMAQSLGGIEYTEAAALHPGAYFPSGEQEGGLDTELLLLDTAGSVLEQLDDDLSDYNSRELEAAAVAGQIKRMVDEDTGLTVWDDKKGCCRRAGYGDVVILLRSVSGWAECFTEVLTHRGIPAFAESRTGYFDTPEVGTILNLLAVIDNPIEDIALAAVLKAPFAGLTDEELAYVTAYGRKTAARGRDRGLYGAVSLFLDGEAPDRAENAPIIHKLEHFFAMLKEFREAASYLSMHELLYRIFDQTGYYDYVSAKPAGEIRRANLDMLVEKAASYEATSYRGVFHFIRYIEKLQKYNTDFGEASLSGGQGDTVRIMSIHKSKGLEFPIVILAGMGKLFNKQDTRGKILIDSDFGIATDYLDSERRLKGATIKKNILKRRMELEALGEELRVLYVAMTRAKEKLILTAASASMETKLEKWKHLDLEDGRVPFTVLTLAGSFLDWILMAMAEAGVGIRVTHLQAENLLKDEIRGQLGRRAAKEELLSFDTSRVYDEAYEAQLERSFQFHYPCAADVLLGAKLSVSEIKKADFQVSDEESAFLPTLPVFMEQEKKAKSGVNRGTAYHRVMELLPFEQITSEEEVKKFLDRLVAEKKLTGEAGTLIWPADLWHFADSRLGRRMRQAASAGKLYRERQFVMGIPAREVDGTDSDELVLIQGIIDAYFEEEDGLVLVDYKTDYVDQPETLVSRYHAQFEYYEKALVQILKKPVKEKYIYSYRLGTIEL